MQVLSAVNEDTLHSYIKQHELNEYELFIETAIVQEKKTFRLFVGAFDSKEKAKILQKKLKNKKNIEAIVVIRSH